jgi:alanyl-tRNA synthetase
MQGTELRSAYLEFFRSKGHQVVSSSPLVPQNDPTLLFSNAGMNQFKDLFLGAEKRAYTRATSCQKCLRISGKHNDLENVGVTARHHTFFEMLGNFSFGDYFKADAITFAWELVTTVFRLPEDRLWVTVYEKDDEAEELWVKLAGVKRERIIRLGEADNFWAMGDTGPCGPCSEIHYYIGNEPHSQSKEGFLRDDGSYLEFWNLVFMQYDRSPDGTLNPLPKPSVDTGMGLERMASILQGKKANYDSDLLRPVISLCEELSGFRYDGSSYLPRDLRADPAYARDVAMRVAADHSRATAFLVADGVRPGSDGRGYVLRRLIRRAARHGRVLGFTEPFLYKACDTVIKEMGGHYAELAAARETVEKVVLAEEKKFQETLDSGLALLSREVEKLASDAPLPGAVAFLLHDTYGFPLDLTEDVLKGYGRSVDQEGFRESMEAQRSRSREDRRAQAITYTAAFSADDQPATKFLGYERTESEAPLLKFSAPEGAREIGVGAHGALIFAESPFYGESGGQVGDTGRITFAGGSCVVHDVQKTAGGHLVHYVEVTEGELSPSALGQLMKLSVDAERRERIRLNHSATHLVHYALRAVLGDHVKQAGSRVDDQRLRFDFSHGEPVTARQLELIAELVQQEIRRNSEVVTEVLPIEEARKTGAVALFGEKYGDFVRVVRIGPESVEFCGGTHASRSGDIGFVWVDSEAGISSGVRRIECFSGIEGARAVQAMRADVDRTSDLLKGDGSRLSDRVGRMLQQIRQLERDLESTKARLAVLSSAELVNTARTTPGGIRLIAERVETSDPETLRTMVDSLRQKLGSGVVALCGTEGDQAVMVAGVTADLVKTVHAGNLVKEASKVGGGRGGGRADFAQAGGLRPEQLSAALARLVELVG